MSKMDMEKLQDLEKRKFQRLKDNIFILGAVKATHADEFKAFTRDISGGGLMFETERDIPAGSELELEIYQPSNSRKKIIFSVYAVAKIVWAREIEKDSFKDGENKYQIGVEFSEIKEQDRQMIINFVN
ncbi:MAG: PilZ domain-containing protein [Nitrospirae bacterium]|nr:PilZ domain-containing protein [Nitrospirota bacterium]MBI3377189.1 PilZ domain-containing protein [Nitrospirota bacterium]